MVLESIGGFSNRLVGSRLLLRAEFVQYTPLWPGDFDGRSFTAIGDMLVPGYPSSSQLVGRARYLMRIAQISSRKEYPKTHRDADRLVAMVFGSTAKASMLQVRTIYEPLRDGQDAYYLSLDQARRVFENFNSNNYRSVFKDWQLLAFRRLRELLGINNNIMNNEQRLLELQSYINDEALMLMAIPRIYLALSSVRNPRVLVEKQPIRGGYYKLIVEVKLHRQDVSVSQELLVLALASLVLTPQILGLGKAANRGLGRFRLIGYEFGPASSLIGDYTDMLESHLLKLLSGSVLDRDVIKKAIDAYLDLALKTLHSNPYDYGKGLPVAPSLRDASPLYTDSPRHPCPYAIQELRNAAQEGLCRSDRSEYSCSRIEDESLRLMCVLSAIGMSTLKSVWKAYNEGDIEKPGPRYHTWILGLPRNVKGIGYVLVERQVENSEDNEDRLPGEQKERINGTVINVRHQSVFNIFPLPDHSVIVIRTPSRGSLSRVLEDRSRERDRALYHVGIHRRNKGGKHWAKVSYIARSKQSSEFPDKFGVARPRYASNDNGDVENVGSGDVYSIVLAVEDAAVEWLRALLGVEG